MLLLGIRSGAVGRVSFYAIGQARIVGAIAWRAWRLPRRGMMHDYALS